MAVLKELSTALAETVESAGKGVVRVEGRRRMGASGFVWGTDGLIVTANHVLERDEDIKVGLAGGNKVEAEFVGRDPTTDLAVLRVEGADLTPSDTAEPDAISVGNLVLALGRPGKTVQATLGIVSALGKTWRTRAGGQIDRYLQTDVVTYPGFSGGPLVDASGNIVGLNTSALTRGVTVSIPVPTVASVTETLVTHGRVRRGHLGIGAQVVRLPDGIEKDAGQESGLIIVSVESKSPAETGGIMLGDTVVAFNDTSIRHMDDLLAELTGDTVGQIVKLRVIRGGELKELTVTIGDRSPEA